MSLPPENPIDIFLQPGEVYFGDAGTRIRTLLGSCVAVTLWHPILRVGGMCHYLLPTRGRRRATETPGADGRYADEAMALLIKDIGASGTRPSEYQAKLFGGGRMFAQHARGHRLNVAERNVLAARSLAQQHGLQIVAESLGGCTHRNVIFEVWSGDVWVRAGPALEQQGRNRRQAA
ncbi:MAG TPA: chemotaxis protein CheD [Burkholderiales bacterium]|nr:chemotaxis protein CheD [Burkholderiales bacterium]